jgi:hypothetical protein
MAPAEPAPGAEAAVRLPPTAAPEPGPAPAAPPVVESTADAPIEDDEDEDEAPEDADAPDPTIGRYEPLDETALDAADLNILRAEAERLALSGSHKVGPADPAGPGSLVETLMRLEEEGRMVSRVCDDAESGFYILYEPIAPA